ncbi:MAG: MarR family transcriptional regulator [Lachnospiraceae bacterium]|nr:MarR family transcriptional regulator [Lachnospiraceae bacterium]
MEWVASEFTEIAQAANRLSVRIMREEGLGAAESDLLQLVRVQPGISQKEICVQLGMDKGAVTRRAVNLEQKGFLIRKGNPKDARSQILYPTEKAESLKGTGAKAEETFYNWLLETLPDEERQLFCKTLEVLGERAAQECKAGYPNACERLHRAPFEESRMNGKTKRQISVAAEKTVENQQEKESASEEIRGKKVEPDIWLL